MALVTQKMQDCVYL